MSWWKWPQGKKTKSGSIFLPWYTILWRFIFWIPLVIGISITALSIFGAYGRTETVKFLRENLY
jgi:hypothetical protein